MIVKIEKSPKEHKRFRVTMDNGKTYDFGLDVGNTYLDHGDKIKRYNYLQRHLANKTEEQLILNLVPSPSLFSALILWGPYVTMEQNVNFLNTLWEYKHKGVEFDFFHFFE